MRKNFDKIDLQEAMDLAQSDTGRQLMAMLQGSHADAMRTAKDNAKNGNMDAARQALTAFMADPQTQALLRRLQEERHG